MSDPLASHPRYRSYPNHRTYMRMRMEFRPFVMYVNEPNFRSEPVNTNWLGFREEYWRDGRFLDWRHLRGQFESCDLLIGSSTAFGVDASSDRATITHFMNSAETSGGGRAVPILNLGVRGALSQQELLVYWFARRYLPKPRNIVIFSGVNAASFAAMADTVFYDDFGGIFGEVRCFDLFCEQYKKFAYTKLELTRSRTLQWVAERFDASPLLQRLANYRFPPEARLRADPPAWTFAQKLDRVLELFANDLATWRLFQNEGAKVHFVLQPALGWTAKPLAELETAIMQADHALDPTLGVYAHRAFYADYCGRVEKASVANGIQFYDANCWLDEPQYSGKDLFTDVCHMNDEGYEAMAELLQARLAWH